MKVFQNIWLGSGYLKVLIWGSFFSILMNIPIYAQQSSASATITATIVRPIGITKTVDLNFGNISASNEGTVILSPAGTRTITGGVVLPPVTGSVSAAAFEITGEGSFTYAITLPSSVYIKSLSGSANMLVSVFTSSPSVTGQLASGSQTLFVGATLVVGNAQPVDVYKIATGFDVTINYN